MNIGNEAKNPLRILHLEDSQRDAELIRERLIDAGFSPHLDWASNEQEFTDFLRNNAYELILADYQLSGFEAPAALRLAKSLCPGIPFICVSGAIGEERAVELLKQGATDYVLKGRLEKLPLAVQRALNEVEERTARRLAEKALNESEVKFHTLFDYTSEAVMLLDEKHFFDCNKATLELFGIDTQKEFCSTHPGALSPPQQPCGTDSGVLADLHIATAMEKGSYRFEWVHRRVDNGKDFLAEVLLSAMQMHGKAVLQATVHDITDRKMKEEQIGRSLKEKEVMLQEIHHRVKNNMQVIISLLNLQSKAIADKTVRALFEESQNRISSMSLVHEKLYQSKDLSQVDFKDYLQSLLLGIAATYKRHDVVISVAMEPLTLDVNVGIPCGLIVNELVSNCLKHAFPDGRKGTITVGINRDKEGNNALTVEDNGVGFPETVDFRSTSSLGLQLVNVLTGQIHGVIELSKTEGTKFTITFTGNQND